MVPTGTPPTNPYPVCSVMDLSLKIQAEMVPIGNSFHKPTPGTLPRECFFYISKAKIGLTGTLRWLLLQVVPSMLSMGCLPYPSRLKSCPREATPTNPCPVRSLQDVSLTHPGWNGPYRNSSHKPVPSMFSMGCFSYTSRLKWCLREHLPQTSAQYAIYRMFLSHIQAEMVPMANISHKTMPRTLSMGCFSYTSRLKWWLQEHLPQTSAQ